MIEANVSLLLNCIFLCTASVHVSRAFPSDRREKFVFVDDFVLRRKKKKKIAKCIFLNRRGLCKRAQPPAAQRSRGLAARAPRTRR